MYFEIIYRGKTLITGDDLLATSFRYEINKEPSFSAKLPIKYYPYLMYKNEIKIHLDAEHLIHGLIMSKTIDKTEERIDVEYEHVLFEWTYQSVPTNVAKKGGFVSTLMKDPDIVYQAKNGEDPWTIKVYDDCEIEYEFSRETKREALDKIIELTPDLNWRVTRSADKTLEIGKFGEHKEVLVSYENILDNLEIEDDNSAIINYAVTLSDKNEGGATSVTLKEVFEHPELQIEGFPVIITGQTINTQSPQVGYNFTEYAPNTINEYAVIDEEGIRRENGDIYEGTYTNNDIQPIQEDGKEITNEDRIKTSQMLYQSTVRKNKMSRRNLKYTFSLGDIPADLNVGDMVRLVFKNNVDTYSGCYGLQTTPVIKSDAWLYVLTIDLQIQDNGSVVYQLTVAQDISSYNVTREY